MGKTDKKTELILAPLHGFTDVIFRNIYSQYFPGFDMAIAPFISTLEQQRINPARTRDVLPELNRSLPVTPQILSRSPLDFIFLASRFADMGHTCVNWNLGCPQQKIVKNKKGAGLIPFIREIDVFLDTVFSRISIDLSIKVRLGKKDPNEIYPLLKVFNKYPLKEIILHPRTGVQFYKGIADIDAFESVSERTNHRMVYNGDIVSKDFFCGVKNRFPAITRFMIGRGALEKPFLPGMIKNSSGISKEDSLKILYSFIDDLFNGYQELMGGKKLIGRMKGFWTYFIKSFKACSTDYKNILLSQTEDEYKSRVKDLFSNAEIQGCP